MLSSQELLNVINGRSSLTDPKSVGIEIERCKALLDNGLDYYKPPSSAAEAKIKSATGVKRKEFILKLSKFLDLDAEQTNEVFQNYLRMAFRGSGPQLQAILKHETQLERLLLKVLEFYFKERISLLACVKYVITYWQDESCLYHNEFVKTVDALATMDIMKKIIKQLKDCFKKPANHDAIKGYPLAITEFAMQFLKEQCYLAEIILLYYKDFDMPLHTFIQLATFFRCQHFGASQVNHKFLPHQAEFLTNCFGFISSLILLEGLDLELLRKFSCEEDKTDVNEHHLVAEQSWKKIDELLYSWDDVPQQGPVIMAWTLFRQLCLPVEQQPLTKVFGDAALRCNVIGYLQQILTYPLFDKINDPLASLVKSFVYVLLSVVLTIFHQDSLGDYQAILCVACNAISDPVISHVFWTQDQSGGVALLLNAAKKRFPAMVCPYVDLLTNLCTAREIADYVFDDFDQLTSFTELFGKNNVSEIEACDEKNVWRRTMDRVVAQHLTDRFDLPAGVNGKVFQHKQDTRLIRWSYSYSGWRHVLLQLNAIAEEPMTYTTDCGEEGLTVAKSIVHLCTAIIKHDTSKAQDMEPIISTVIRLLQRLSVLTSPPLDLLGSCLRCLQLITYQIPIQIWHQLSKTKFLPSQKFVVLKVKGESCLQQSPGTYGMIISKHEVPLGKFSVTKEYLKFLLDFLNAISMDETSITNSCDVSGLLNDLAINISFVIKEIFVNFGKWRYKEGDKEIIGERCLEIFHKILSASFTDIPVPDNKSAPSLKAIVKEGLLYHNAAGSLISIVGIGVDGIEAVLFDSARQDTKLVQLVKLCLAVINKLFSLKDENEELSPLEKALCHQYVQQVPDLDFLQETNKVTILSVIAKFIFHCYDPKLPILSMVVLRALAAKFPMMLMASFGEAVVGIRNAFVNKLNGRVEAVRLKISIVEFLSTCVETQPGIIESFSHLVTEKNKETVLGRFSCLTPLLDILLDKKHINVLSSTVMEFMAALWTNRHDIAMQVIKRRKHFWCSVMYSLLKADQLKVSKPVLEVTSHALKIIAVETYYVRE